MVQLSHPYMTIGKTIALTGWTFVGKGMSLLFSMRSSQGASLFFLFVCLFCFNFTAAVTTHSDFEAQEKKIRHCIHFSPLLFAMK